MAATAAVAAYLISSTQGAVFAAEGQVLISDPRGSAAITDPFTAYIDRGRYVRNQAEVFKSRPVAARASEILGGDPTANEIQSVVTATGEYEFDVLTIGATQPTAQGAIDVVNAVVAAYEEVVAIETQAAADAASEALTNSKLELQVRLAETEAALAEFPDSAALEAQRTAQVAQLATLDTQIEQIAVSSALYGSGIRFYDEPQGATQTAPRPARNAAIALVLGLIAAGAWAWWRDEQRDQVESPQAAAAALDAPMLGTDPGVLRSQGHGSGAHRHRPALGRSRGLPVHRVITQPRTLTDQWQHRCRHVDGGGGRQDRHRPQSRRRRCRERPSAAAHRCRCPHPRTHEPGESDRCPRTRRCERRRTTAWTT